MPQVQELMDSVRILMEENESWSGEKLKELPPREPPKERVPERVGDHYPLAIRPGDKAFGDSAIGGFGDKVAGEDRMREGTVPVD